MEKHSGSIPAARCFPDSKKVYNLVGELWSSSQWGVIKPAFCACIGFTAVLFRCSLMVLKLRSQYVTESTSRLFIIPLKGPWGVKGWGIQEWLYCEYD